MITTNDNAARTAEDYEREFARTFDATFAAIRQREEREAAALGVPVALYRQQLQEREEREQAETRRREERRVRHAILEPIESRLDVGTYRALLNGTRLERTPAMVHVRNWLRDPTARPFLLLTGVTGTGKTVASAYAMTQVRDCEYIHAQEMDERVSPWAAELARGVVPARLNARLVVLDDLGSEATTARSLEALYELVDRRQGRVRAKGRRARARTIITSNLAVDDLLRQLDARVAGRLLQGAQRAQAGDLDLRRARGAS